MKKFIFPSLVVCILSAATLTGCGKDVPLGEYVKAYPMATIEKGNLTFYKELPATVKGINDVDIYPQVSGTITEICFTEGMPVKKGQVLFKINPTIYEARYEKAKANVANARAAVSTARFSKEAKESLLKKSAVSKYDTVSAQNTYDAAVATLDEMEAELKSAKEDLDNTVIKSPVNGVLGMSDVRVGALVSSNMSTPLVSVSDNSYVRAYFSLSEKSVLFLKKLDEEDSSSDNDDNRYYTVKFRLADGEEYKFKGYIDAFSGVVDKTTGAVTVRATFPNAYGLIQSGGSGSVIIPIELKDEIIIPQTATYELQNKIFVYRFVDGKAVATAIKLMSVNDGTSYVVTEGLNVGDVIVTDGAGLLRDGQTIKQLDTPQSAPAEAPQEAAAQTGADSKDQASDSGK